MLPFITSFRLQRSKQVTVQSKLDLVIVTLTLAVGGAEKHVVRIATSAKRSGRKVAVLKLVPGGALSTDLLTAGIEQIELNKDGVLGWIYALAGFVKFLRARKPQVVYSVLSVPNIFCGATSWVFSQTRFVWGIRSSKLINESHSLKVFLVHQLEKHFSRYSDKIIFNSKSGLEYFRAQGFSTARGSVVLNGVDTTQICYKDAGRVRVRENLGLPIAADLVGTLGRADYTKGSDTFLNVACLLFPRNASTYFIAIGRNWSELIERNAEAVHWRKMGRIIELSENHYVADHLSALDIFLLSSRHEGTPNALLEAMSCERPCIVTQAGDATAVVGNPDLVANGSRLEDLVDRIEWVLSLDSKRRVALGQELRQRVLNRFSVESEFENISKELFD